MKTTPQQNTATLRREVQSAIASENHNATFELGIELENAEVYAKGIARDIDRAEQEAARLGTIAGRNAAAWVEQDTWGGRVTRGEKQAAQAFLDAFEDCDYSALPEPPNLSGEWAGGETPASLMLALFGDGWNEIEEYVEAQQDLCTAWEDAANEAFFSSLCASAQSLLS
jgi:hypothetical protein